MRVVRSNTGNDTIFRDWFRALAYMGNEIGGIDLNICILGYRAYGLSLVATIRRMGEKAVHMGDDSQLLSSIEGKRWGNNAYRWEDLS